MNFVSAPKTAITTVCDLENIFAYRYFPVENPTIFLDPGNFNNNNAQRLD